MRILLVALGTRGDVQPLIALGTGLQAAGHEVRLVAGRNFTAWVEGHGLACTPLGVDMQALMNSATGLQWSQEGSRSPFKQISLMRSLMQEHGSAMTAGLREAVGDAEVLVGGFVSDPFVASLAEAHNRQHISLMLQPLRPTKHGPATLIPIFPQRDCFLNRMFTLSSYRALWRVFGDATNELRRALGLPAVGAGWYIELGQRLPSIQAISRHVAPHAEDYPEHVVTTGWLFLDEPYTPPAELTAFLQAGEPPLYIGFGSMPVGDPRAVLDLLLGALDDVGGRAVLAAGWTDLQASHTPESVHLITGAPHGWLFPRVHGVVHHGGSGTTGAGLRAGSPTLIVPASSDQPYWGRRVHELGVGAAPINRPDLTRERLARGLDALLNDGDMARRAAALGERIRAEDGVQNAVAALERFSGMGVH